MDFCHSQLICWTNMEKTLLNTAIEKRLDAAKTAFKKVVHKTDQAIKELIVSKIAEEL